MRDVHSYVVLLNTENGTGHIKFFAAFAERSLEGKDAVPVLLGTRAKPSPGPA
jgi:hypothetical protein